MHGGHHRRYLYDLGVAVNIATQEPKRLTDLLKAPNDEGEPEATGMIAIPKKRR